MKFILLTALVALTHYHASFALDDYCFGKDSERLQTRQFSSKTAYQIIKGTNIDKQYLVPNCTPQKIWILHRHGTRLPSRTTIQSAQRLEKLRDEIVNNYRTRRTAPDTNALCMEDLFALQMWKWNTSITEDQENFLTSQGYDDLRGTAKLYQKYYPNILPRQYTQSNYLFRHTNTQRTTESFKAFAEGLFGGGSNAQPEQTAEPDLLLRPYDYCPSFQNQDYSGPDSQSYKYRQSQIWNTTIADISTRLGFQYTLEVSDIELMYDICRYEQAWQVDRTSAWCAVFLPEQVTVFEYDDDLKYFYKSGYGNAQNTRLNCRAVQDMLTHLNNDTLPNAIVYFSHSTSLQAHITALGINKDDIKLTATNYNQLSDRRWKTSNIDPFAGNFVAVKYQCNAQSVDKEKVIFFLNQNAVELDWCNVGLCNWSDVLKRYDALHKAECDSYYCGNGANQVVGMTLVSLMVAAIVYLI